MALVNCKECGKEVSDKAKTCPHCGSKLPPITTMGTKVILGLILCIVGFIILSAIVKQCSSNIQTIQQESEQNKKRKADSISVASMTYRQGLTLDELKQYYKQSIKFGIKSPQHSQLIAELCTSYYANAISTLDRVISDKNAATMPLEDFSEFTSLCGNNDNLDSKSKSSVLQTRYKQAAGLVANRASVVQKRVAAQAEKDKINVRLAYAKLLRNRYLDQGLDINVSITGIDNTRIKLSFALFNAVWAHKMGNGDLITEIQNMGFKKLTMTDGYDYTVYWNFK